MQENLIKLLQEYRLTGASRSTSSIEAFAQLLMIAGVRCARGRQLKGTEAAVRSLEQLACTLNKARKSISELPPEAEAEMRRQLGYVPSQIDIINQYISM
jgi:hypothetical protein